MSHLASASSSLLAQSPKLASTTRRVGGFAEVLPGNNGSPMRQFGGTRQINTASGAPGFSLANDTGGADGSPSFVRRRPSAISVGANATNGGGERWGIPAEVVDGDSSFRRRRPSASLQNGHNGHSLLSPDDALEVSRKRRPSVSVTREVEPDPSEPSSASRHGPGHRGANSGSGGSGPSSHALAQHRFARTLSPKDAALTDVDEETNPSFPAHGAHMRSAVPPRSPSPRPSILLVVGPSATPESDHAPTPYARAFPSAPMLLERVSKRATGGSEAGDARVEAIWLHYAGRGSSHLHKRALMQLAADVFDEFVTRYRSKRRAAAAATGRDLAPDQLEREVANGLPHLLPAIRSDHGGPPTRADFVYALYRRCRREMIRFAPSVSTGRTERRGAHAPKLTKLEFVSGWRHCSDIIFAALDQSDEAEDDIDDDEDEDEDDETTCRLM